MEVKSLTTVDKLQMILNFLERKGPWIGCYPIEDSNLDMSRWTNISKKDCACLAGHMARDEIFNIMGFKFGENGIVPSYRNYYEFDAIAQFVGITKAEAQIVFSGGDRHEGIKKHTIYKLNTLLENYTQNRPFDHNKFVIDLIECL